MLRVTLKMSNLKSNEKEQIILRIKTNLPKRKRDIVIAF